MLTSITIKNFRTFKDVTIPLKPLTVFIGPNNSGKTNAIRAIQFVTTAAGKGIWPGNDREDLELKTADSAFSLEVAGEFDQSNVRVSLKGPTEGDYLGTASIVVGGRAGWTSDFVSGRREVSKAAGHESSPPNAPGYLMDALERSRSLLAARSIHEYFRGARIASLSVPKLRDPAPISRDPVLGERGENFGAVLDWVSGKHPALFRSINDELRRVLQIEGCTTLVTDSGLKIPAIIEGDQSFGADVISDGVLLYMGLTTVAHLVGPNSLLIIEEPENGIHPRRLKALLEQIRAIGKRGTQVILTTHSPILLDEFSDDPDSIVVFDRDKDGTHVSQPTPEQLKEVLNGDFGLGSLWFSGAIGGVTA